MATNDPKNTRMYSGMPAHECSVLMPRSGMLCSLVELLTSLWFALASLQIPLRPHSQQCVYGFNMCPHTLSHSDPTFYIHHHLPARGWNDVTQHKLKVKAMFALVLVAVPRALAPHPTVGARPAHHLESKHSPQTNALQLSHRKLSVDFIDLAKNQLVNYLISKALWVSAELPPSLQCSQVSLNHCTHMQCMQSSPTHTHTHTLLKRATSGFKFLVSTRLTMTFIFLKLCVYGLRSSSVAQVQISLGCSWKPERYGHHVCSAESMSYDWVCLRSRRPLHPGQFSSCSVIHGSVWVKMHNEFIKGDWRNHERYCLNYWLAARSICFVWYGQPALATELTNLIKCTKCYSPTSPVGAIMASEIERSPRGVFYSLAGDCLCQLADCIDYIDL